ncbi:MAG: IS110 family transposase, partial [Mesorhizobium sp.]
AQLAELVPNWSMAPVVAAYQALRGVSFIVAVTFVSEVGDVRRFDTPRQLMAFLGLVPSERSTGDTVKRGGNRSARRVLIEGAWAYRYPARVTEPIRVRLEDLPKAVREIAWRAQTRLCDRYRRLLAAGKNKPIVVAAIARETAAFLWAIGHQIEPVR